jgi:hypothetical protein
MRERSAWFVRSMGDADTHRGVYSPATRSVHAMYGIEFQPVRWAGRPSWLRCPGAHPIRSRYVSSATRARTEPAVSLVSTERAVHTVLAIHELDKADI